MSEIKLAVLGEIAQVATKYGVSEDEMSDVIHCESGFNNSARGKAGEIGLAQFMPKTWKMWNENRGQNLDIYKIEDQIDMMAWAFSQGYKRHWTCWKLLYN